MVAPINSSGRNTASDSRVMPDSAMVMLPRAGMNFANSSADGPTRANMVSVWRTQASGDSDNLHNSPSTGGRE